MMRVATRFLRQDFYKNIGRYHKKKYCNKCGSQKELELHHVVPFSEQYEKTLKLLGIERKTYWEEYKKKDREKIKLIMLGMQVQNKNEVLCRECHLEEHGRAYK